MNLWIVSGRKLHWEIGWRWSLSLFVQVVRFGYSLSVYNSYCMNSPLLMYHGFPCIIKQSTNQSFLTRSYVGDPIPYDASLTAEQLADNVRDKMTELIQRHQLIPGSIIRALIERLPSQASQSTWTAVAASTWSKEEDAKEENDEFMSGRNWDRRGGTKEVVTS